MQSYSKISDDALVVLYQEGDLQAFAEILRRYKNKVFSHILHLAKDRAVAEDIFQETFFKVIRELRKGHYQAEGKFYAWVIRIAHNLIIDHFRKNGRMPMIRECRGEKDEENNVSIFNLIPASQEQCDEKMIRKQHISFLRQMIEELPYEQKLVLKLRIYEDLSFKEIAVLTGVSINTALGRMRYALLNLKKKIVEKRYGIMQ